MKQDPCSCITNSRICSCNHAIFPIYTFFHIFLFEVFGTFPENQRYENISFASEMTIEITPSNLLFRGNIIQQVMAYFFILNW